MHSGKSTIPVVKRVTGSRFSYRSMIRRTVLFFFNCRNRSITAVPSIEGSRTFLSGLSDDRPDDQNVNENDRCDEDQPEEDLKDVS